MPKALLYVVRTGAKQRLNFFPSRRLPGNDDPPKSVSALLGEVIVALNYFEAAV